MKVGNLAPGLFSIKAPIATIAQLGDEDLGDVLAGLDRLARSPPLWSCADWPAMVDRAKAFAGRWSEPAQACGWSRLDLWSVHRRAPGARLASLGAAIIAARRGDRVVELDAAAILVVTRLGSRLRIYRTAPDPERVLAWRLCPAA
jgi:hypothetical protein